MAQSLTELRILPKDSLIKMACKKIDEPSFDVQDFNQIEIWVDDPELSVEFGHVIRFIPRKGQYYYSVSVDLVSGTTGRLIQGDSPTYEEVRFYKPAKFQEKIKFVMNAISNSHGEVGKIPEGKLPDGTMTIREEAGYYDIEVDSESTHSYYKIKKGSGKIYDAGHKHYYRDDTPSKRERIY